MLRANIDLSDLKVEIADGMATLTKESQEQMEKLLEVKETILELEAQAKLKIAELLNKVEKEMGSTPLLSKAGRVRIYYREYGEKYVIDPQMVNEIPNKFYSVDKKYKANADELELYFDEFGTIPKGVAMPDRTKKVSLRLMEIK